MYSRTRLEAVSIHFLSDVLHFVCCTCSSALRSSLRSTGSSGPDSFNSDIYSHDISTQVRDTAHYFNLLQCWFVFPRESILRYVSPRDRLLVYLLGIAPTLFSLFLVLVLLFCPSWSKLAYTLLYFSCSWAIVDEFNKKYLRHAQPAHKTWLIPVMFVLIPVQILCSFFLPQQANWRANVVQIEPGGFLDI